ncbi:hypothetical protein DFJ77DRAFT_88443 [Powellomyces hirtus]|nr:hypothetical protein DFJ77DRAFT_88443 [Powellomyces hirtus]
MEETLLECSGQRGEGRGILRTRRVPVLPVSITHSLFGVFSYTAASRRIQSKWQIMPPVKHAQPGLKPMILISYLNPHPPAPRPLISSRALFLFALFVCAHPPALRSSSLPAFLPSGENGGVLFFVPYSFVPFFRFRPPWPHHSVFSDLIVPQLPFAITVLHVHGCAEILTAPHFLSEHVCMWSSQRLHIYLCISVVPVPPSACPVLSLPCPWCVSVAH